MIELFEYILIALACPLVLPAVSRQAVLDVIYGQHIGGKEAVEHGLRNTYAGDLREIADEIIALPSVRPQEQTKKESK